MIDKNDNFKIKTGVLAPVTSNFKNKYVLKKHLFFKNTKASEINQKLGINKIQFMILWEICNKWAPE